MVKIMIMRKIILQLFVLPLISLQLQTLPVGGHVMAATPASDSVWFTCQNTCLHDATLFHAYTTGGITAVRWMWLFGNLGISHVAAPQFFFDLPGDYTVTLTVYDETGTPYEHTETITIHPLPQPVITGEEYIVCRNARNVLFYTPLTAGHAYEWNLDNETVSTSGNYVYLNFGDQSGLPKQVRLTLTETSENGCVAHAGTDILITHFTAPPEGIVIRKTASPSSRLLLCLLDDPEKYSYNWGYSSFSADSVITTDFESGFIHDNFYPYPDDIDTVNHIYWVQILDPVQNSCFTTSFLGNLTGDEMKAKQNSTGH